MIIVILKISQLIEVAFTKFCYKENGVLQTFRIYLHLPQFKFKGMTSGFLS